MAAGLGFKDFSTGEVLTAADVDGYLMQGVWVFANAAARTSAVTSPQEGNASFLKDTNSLEIYDGAAWVAYGAGDITGVTAGTGISGGGTSGTVTVTNSMATEITAKGDLIVGTGNATFDNLPAGTNGHVLTADSTISPTGLKWAAPASGSTFAGCYVSITTSVSIANDTWTKLPFNTEVYDTDGYHDNSTNNTRMTIPSGKGGYYQINASSQWGVFAESVCRLAVYVNNSIVTQNSITKTNNFRGFYTRSYILNLAVGDYVEIAVQQGSGNAQDVWGDDSGANGTSCSIGFIGA